MQKYLVLTVGMTKETATAVMTGVLVVFMALQPFMGLLSDRIGRRNNILLLAALMLKDTRRDNLHDAIWV